jgi:hypothetical protein
MRHETLVGVIDRPGQIGVPVGRPERILVLATVAGRRIRAGEVEVAPVKRELGIDAEGAPVVDAGVRIALGDPSLAIHTQSALLNIKDRPQLGLL